ncbi:hypothetical protein ACFQE4_13985 [Streptomyces thermocoprophilus]|uniref:Uncharacterized protein n=1 Tax=Streptomyces thermocoprophilus TaxID=78356 RepID=A0ABV5VN12_9ACTN
MIYGYHRSKGAPVLGALPGQHGPFGRRPAQGEDDDTDMDEELEPAASLPAPTDGSAMMTLWRQVLAALTDDTLNDATRETIVARGAAQLAVRRAPEGQQPTSVEVMAVAYEEFKLLLDADQARAALRCD